jgi:hypothetical protein
LAAGGIGVLALPTAAEADVVVGLALPPRQVFAVRSDRSSSVVGAGPSTTTSVTRRTTWPVAVRMETRYVPASSGRPCTAPANRTRFSPACALTVKRPIPTQAGDTCFTVKTTRAACPRTKVKVVVRRRRGPLVPIQPRDEWKCSARGPLAVDAPLGDAAPALVGANDAPPVEERPDPAAPPGDVGDVSDETAFVAPAMAPLTGAGAEDDEDAVVTGSGTVGVGTGVDTVVVGRVGTGTGDVGTVTVTVGTGGSVGGGGSETAAAVPASDAAAAATATQTRSRIPE